MMDENQTSKNREAAKSAKVRSGVTFKLTSEEQLQLNKEFVKEHSSEEFQRLIKEAMLKLTKNFFWTIFSFVLGAFVVAFWDLNSEVYRLSGQYSAKSELSDFKEKMYQEKIIKLESKISEFECLNDIRVKNKAECRK